MTEVSLYCSVGSELHKLDGLWSSITWSGDTKMAYRSVEFTLANTENGKTRKIKPSPGSLVRLKRTSDKKELFRGYVFRTDISTDGTQSFTAYDPNIYLSKSTGSHMFKNKTASQILKVLAIKYGIPTDSIADTKIVLPKLVFRDKSPSDIITIALTETRKRGGERFVVGNNKGKLTLSKVSTANLKYKATTTTNIISGSYSESIEDRKTKVAMTGGDEAKVSASVTSKSASSIKKYGIMQEYENKPDIKDKAKLQKLADALLKQLNVSTQDFSIEVIGNTGFTAGRRLYVEEPMSSRKGYFYIVADSHTFNADGTHTASLTLKRKIELPTESYEAPSENKTSDKWVSSTGKYAAVHYQTGWKATAYAYQLGGINGSKAGITASGTKVKEGRTIAVDPSVIPLGSIVAVYVPSAKQYSGIYLAEDTGGAIKGHKIDIAHNPKGVYDFGIKNIQVSILKQGTGRSDARAKASNWSSERSKVLAKLKSSASSSVSKASYSKADQVVAIGRSFKGKLRYIFGGKNIASGGGDCSGFTYYCFKKIGVNIGHGTSTQLTKGKPVSKLSAQPGDLVFFKNTYRAGVSHVGIVTTPGKFVNLQSSGCKEESYMTGYWAKHYLAIRRVL
ncbi:XkdQ/YqbQ family protein [Rummeliibacillus suwonensis]|uniref:XkdQ/YqbQ family protein n=1 Tax=Rummeliibacillus suwonensis TaxID=1306154 RepID=UPI0011B58C5F|nr:NlpC/P60 family protein [Rummeliibacillus suwonensis]